MTEEQDGTSKQRFGLERLAAFTDGMIAIAITLLVLSLRIPDKPDIPIKDALIANIPLFEAWIVSFVIIGIMWFRHHTIFFMIKDAGIGLIVINMIFLLFVTLVPWALHIRSVYPKEPLATILLSGTLGMAWNFLTFMFIYALHNGHVMTHRLHKKTRKVSIILIVIGVSTMMVSFALAYVNVRIALYCWSIAFLVYVCLYAFSGPGGYFTKDEDFL